VGFDCKKPPFEAGLANESGSLECCLAPGDTNGKVPYRCIVAGASNTSALVAFEEFGYVPSKHAISYVHANDDWVAAQTWDAVEHPKSLAELQNTISQVVLPTSGR
jgi:hypothetical protein